MNKFLLVVLGVILLGSVVVYSGCGPRMGVIKDKAISELDKILGELNVKAKSIEQKRAALKTELENVRDQRVEAKVRLEQMEKKKQNSDSKIKELDAKLVQINDILKTFGDQEEISRNGKTYTKAEVNRMAQDLINERRNVSGDLASAIDTSYQAIQRSYDYLVQLETTSNETMRKLDDKIEQIRSKKEAIDQVRQTSLTIGTDDSLLTKISNLNKEVEDLDVNIETRMRVEEEKLKEFTNQSQTIDDLLADPTDVGSTISEIEAILKGGTTDDK